MKYLKADIITEYIKLKMRLGQPPSSKEFYEGTGINKRQLEKAFGSNSYSKLVNECGDVPQEFFRQKSDLEDILVKWGGLARKLGKIPTSGDWAFHDCTPTESGIKASHSLKWSDIPYKFLEFYSGNQIWNDVVDLIPKRYEDELLQSKSTAKIEGLGYQYLKFIPPIVQDLVALSVSEEKAIEFEKSVNLVFEMLGFEVTEYGQGTGRNPDGIAKDTQNRYAILIDAKARKENYKIGTEDRKFIEYIKAFSEPLKKMGFNNIYLLIVSSGFESVSATAIKNIKIETQVATTLLTSRLLLKILSKKIQSPRLFDLKRFQGLLIEDGEITEKKIDKFIAEIK